MKLIVIFVLTIFTFSACTTTNSLSLKQEEIYSLKIIDYFIQLEGGGLTYDFVETSDNKIVKECIQTINSIRIYTGENLENERSGDSPSAYLELLNKEGKKSTVYFYDEILRYNGVYYRIDMSEYEKLQKLCSIYGKYHAKLNHAG